MCADDFLNFPHSSAGSVCVCALSPCKLYVACSVCSLMPASADSSVGDMQAAARSEQSGAERADCWSQWPSKTTAGWIRALPEGGERGMTVSPCLPVCVRSCSALRIEGVDGAAALDMTLSPLSLLSAFFKNFPSVSFLVPTPCASVVFPRTQVSL